MLWANTYRGGCQPYSANLRVVHVAQPHAVTLQHTHRTHAGHTCANVKLVSALPSDNRCSRCAPIGPRPFGAMRQFLRDLLVNDSASWISRGPMSRESGWALDPKSTSNDMLPGVLQYKSGQSQAVILNIVPRAHHGLLSPHQATTTGDQASGSKCTNTLIKHRIQPS